MPTVIDIEDSIRTLPARDFLELAEWMCRRHLEVLTADGFESAELEAEILQGLDAPRYPVDDVLYADIRQSWKKPGH